MGIAINEAEFLIASKNRGVNFRTTCTLGRQSIKLLPSGNALVRKWIGLDLRGQEYAESFFNALGAENVHAIDSSAYENADIIHNLNDPLPADLLSQFDCLIDGGTLEHVFDFPRALADCMKMVRVGGHLIIFNMANDLMGHGFYQFSPELFYSSLTPENGYEITSLLLHEKRGWFEPKNPKLIGKRVQAATRGETYIFVCAKRISDVEPFINPPHQSDYISNLRDQSIPEVSPAAQDLTAKQKLAATFPVLIRLKSHLETLKKKVLFPLFPIMEDWDERLKHSKHLRSCQLTNKSLFRKIGKRITY